MVSKPPLPLCIGALVVFAALPCPLATIGSLSIRFVGTGYGIIIGLGAFVLVGAMLFRRPSAATVAAGMMAALALGLGLILLGAVNQYGGSLGWGWGVLALGLGLAMAGAWAWSTAERSALAHPAV